MNFKKLAEQKIDELSGKIPVNVVENDSIYLVLEGLDEEIPEKIVDEFDLEIINEEEIDLEIPEEHLDQDVVELFDGYLGEKSEIPNPLEYGPNATYRNLREGVVYKKNSENLWESFLKDGKSGKNGHSVGSGIGINEANKLISVALSNVLISGGTNTSAYNELSATNLSATNVYIKNFTDISGNNFSYYRKPLKHSGWLKQTLHTSPLAPQTISADSTIFGKFQVPVNEWNCSIMLENYGVSALVYDNVSIKVAGNGTTNNSIVRLTKNGSTTITVPPAIVSVSSSTNSKYGVPGIIELDLPNVIQMDNINTSIPTSAPFFIYLRAHSVSGGTVVKADGYGDTNFPNGAGVISGDYTTSAWPTVTYLTASVPQFCALNVRAKSKVVTILGIGDSHLASEGWFSSAVAYANSQVTDRKLLYFKQAYGGVGSITFKQWAQQYISAVNPDYVYVPWGTFNDGGSSTIPPSRQNVRAIIDICESLNIGIITSTPHPLDGNSGGSFVTRTNEIANEIRNHYPDYVDIYALVGDPATSLYLPGMSDDGTHLNATGTATIQPNFNELFLNILKR